MLKIRSIVDPRFKFKQLYYEKKIIRNKIRNLIKWQKEFFKNRSNTDYQIEILNRYIVSLSDKPHTKKGIFDSYKYVLKWYHKVLLDSLQKNPKSRKNPKAWH